MANRRAHELELSTDAQDASDEHAGSEHPESSVMRVTGASADTSLHDLLDRQRSVIVERFVRALRKNMSYPHARAAVIDDLVFFIADLADALRNSVPPDKDRARRHGNRRHRLGFDLNALLREYSVLRRCILEVARENGATLSADEIAVLDRTIDDSMSDAVMAYTEDRDAEVERERKALEDERARLAQAVASRDDVLAIVSHDLRNPLTSIALGVEQLRRHASDPERRERVLDSIERSAQRMTTLIEDLLAIAKIDAGQLSLQVGEVDARALVEDALAIVGPVADAKSIELQTSVDDGISLAADRDRLLQVLGNLLSNALKFTPDRGIIVIDVERRGDVAEFCVRDNGPGIPEESLPYVFDRFYQAPAKRRGGAGLGLAIVRAIVEKHGGTIGVESSVGRGTKFHFTVPLAKV
jgi:signal transduction histidine kinase